MNSFIDEHISAESNLRDIDSAILIYATQLNIHQQLKLTRTSGKFSNSIKITQSYKKASQLQCAMDALDKGGIWFRNKLILKPLCAIHHALNITTRTCLLFHSITVRYTFSVVKDISDLQDLDKNQKNNEYQ